MDAELTQFQKTQMEAILGPDSDSFQTFLSDHNSEKKLMSDIMKKNDPDSLAITLCNFLRHSNDLYIRERCAQLLDKLITGDDLSSNWHNLNDSTQSTIKCILAESIIAEESEFIIEKLMETILKLVYSLHPTGTTWPELLPSLYQCVTGSSSNDRLKALAFAVFGYLTYDEIHETTVPYCVNDLHSLFLKTLNDDTLHVRVRMASTIAGITFIQRISNSSKEKDRFQDLLPGMLKSLTDSLIKGVQELATRQVLSFFIQLAKNEPRFLKRQLVNVVGTVFDITEAEGIEELTRCLAVDFLITLVEARERAPGMMKRLPSFIDRCFAVLLKLLLDIRDDSAWHNAETMHYVGSTSIYYQAGALYLIRFSLALGGNSIAHIAVEQLSAYLAAPEWEKRHAALYALACIAKGCSKVMIKNVEQLMFMVLNFFQDPHPQVRWAACCAITMLLEEFSPHLQEQYHNIVIPALAAALDDFTRQVQACAAGALSSFCVADKPETLIRYLDGIVNKLLVLLQNDKQMVQQEALNALSCIARSVKEHFRTYYDTVMPHLKVVLRNADVESNLILCARAIECISSVGFAVGKEKFREDAEQVMEVLITSFQELQVKGGDPPTKYLLKACGIICDCLGQDFLPYMSAVIPFIIQCAQLEPVLTILTEWTYKKIKVYDDISDKVLQDKATACILLRQYAIILKEDFYPWIPQVVAVFIPILKFYYHDDVRKCAVTAMHYLLRSAKLAVKKGIAEGEIESYFTKLSDCIILSLLEALHEEPMAEICAVMLGELDECLQICQPLLSEGQLRKIVDEVKHVVTESSNRKRKLKERAKSEDFDAEEDELLSEEKEQEGKILVHVGLVLTTLIKTFKAAFLPFFDELMSSYLIPMWGKEMTVQERCTPFFIFDHLLEECPEAALKYSDEFLPLLLDASNDESPAVRQCALYGLVLYAEYGGYDFKPVVKEVISRINVVILHFRAREPENESAFDNAVYALGKICQFHWENIDSSAQIIPLWLNCLPIKCDMAAAKYVHDQLCSMVERLDGELIGPNYQYIPKIISVFAEVLCSEIDLATEETTNRMINVLRHLQQTLPSATLESAWSYLLPRQEMELRSILSLEEDVNF